MDTFMTYFAEHHDKLLYALAGLSLVLELSVMGMSGILLFFGIGCAVTGILVSLGLVSSWEMEVLIVGVSSGLSAVLLWKPLKRFQGTTKLVKDDSSDMIGQIVPVSEAVTATGGSIRHSGINWSARLDEQSSVEVLEKDSRVVITAVQGTLIVVDQQ